MAELAVAATIASTVLSAAGQIQQGNAAKAAGKAQQQSAEFQAKQMQAQAGQERAASQRVALNKLREKNLAQSRARAVAAAGGGDTSDASVVNILSDLESEGQYNADVALYQGEDRARDLLTGANIKKYEGAQAYAAGKAAKKSSTMAAFGTVLKGASGMSGKYSDPFSSTDYGWSA